MNKERIKGIATGFILCAVLSTSAIAIANTQTSTREITHGVGVMFNGEIVQFDHDTRPFVMEGRTFLPLRTLTELLGLPVDFDPASNMAIIGSAAHVPVVSGTPIGSLFFEGDTMRTSGNQNTREQRVEHDSVAVGGTTHSDSVVFAMHYPWGSGNTSIFTQFANLNLNRNYNRLTGQIGRVDGSRAVGATVSIFGDNRLLQEFEFGEMDFPVPISLFVEGINMVRVEIVHTMPGFPNVLLGDVAFAFTGVAE